MIATDSYEDDEVTIELSVRTDKVGSEVKKQITIPREEWDEMNDCERDEYMLEILLTTDLFEWGYDEQN